MEQKNAITLYESAAETIKTAILQGQYEALKGENRVQLAVYFCFLKYSFSLANIPNNNYLEEFTIIKSKKQAK